jgi:hypothetical protein
MGHGIASSTIGTISVGTLSPDGIGLEGERPRFLVVLINSDPLLSTFSSHLRPLTPRTFLIGMEHIGQTCRLPSDAAIRLAACTAANISSSENPPPIMDVPRNSLKAGIMPCCSGRTIQPQIACFLSGLSCSPQEGRTLLIPKTSIMPKMNRFVAIQMATFLETSVFKNTETSREPACTTSSVNNLTPLVFLDEHVHWSQTTYGQHKVKSLALRAIGRI